MYLKVGWDRRRVHLDGRLHVADLALSGHGLDAALDIKSVIYIVAALDALLAMYGWNNPLTC